MKIVSYVIAKIRLVLAGHRVNVARGRMNSVLNSSRAAEDEIDRSYENFIRKAKEREKAAVNFKRIKNESFSKPLLKLDLGVEHYIVQPALANRITRLEAELAFTRHRYGDWGECGTAVWRENNRVARGNKGTLRSRYPLVGNDFFIVETDKRRRITVMYPEGEPA